MPEVVHGGPPAPAFSRLMLGTAQFGLPYGIANRAGQPGYREVLGIVAAAIEGGVNCFDTAAGYGSSEEVLGRTLHELRAVDRVTVVTKVRPLNDADGADPCRAIEESVAESRRRLRLDCLPLVLFHKEADAVHMDGLLRLCDRGWIRRAGFSCDTDASGSAPLAARPGVAALQIPANVLDRRHRRAGTFATAAARGAAVFVRSVYLQGLLLMPEEEIPAPLRQVVPVRRALATIATAAGMSLAELAARHALGLPGVTSLVMGVDGVAHLRENLAICGRGPLDAETTDRIEAAVPDLPADLLTPRAWEQQRIVPSWADRTATPKSVPAADGGRGQE